MAKILLVEDDNSLREIFEMRLQADGYQTVTASNGEEGLSVAMKEKPDLIIADVMMPKLSGFDMLENLRAAPEMKDTKVIMMTALGQAEDRARGENLGVVRYLVKSQATLEDFAKVVKEVLSPGGSASAVTSNSNQQESEKPMQQDQPSNNPAGGDAPASEPTSTPDDSGAGATPPAGDAQLSSAQEQSNVQGQIDNFVADAPAAPAAAGTDDAAPADAPTTPSSSFAPTTPAAPDAPASPYEPATGTTDNMSGSDSTSTPDIPVATPPADDTPAETPADKPEDDKTPAPGSPASTI